MQNITEILKKIEEQRQIRILYACETGSRAWGFPSPDSDYDIRFIYMHERDWYLSLSQRKDSIEIMDGEMDITGWDLKKCLMLLKKSNAPLIERFQSPIEYHSDKDFKNDFQKLIKSYYSPIAVFFHHYSLAHKFWAGLKDEKEFKLKSYFYLIRSLLSCNWIRNNDAVLPMDIEGLMKYVDEEPKAWIRDLIVLKSGKGEKYLCQKNEKLHQWITDLFITAETAKSNLVANRSDMTLLNEMFLKMLYARTDN